MSRSIQTIAPDNFAQVQQFCALQFGAHSYQTHPTYLSWLYQDNKLGNGQGLRISNNSTLVTVAHEMMAWSHDFDHCIVPHNLFSYPDTSTGMGGTVIMRYSKVPMIVPGATLPLTKVYQAAKFIEIPLRSYMIAFVTPTAVLAALRQKVFKSPNITISRAKLDELASKYRVKVDYALDPNSACYDHLVGEQNLAADFLGWRYFSTNGPTTFVVSDDTGAFCYVNIGLRHGLPLARMGDSNMTTAFAKNKLLPLLKKLGAVVVMANSKRPNEWGIFEAINMRRANPNLKAFVTKHVNPSHVTSPAFSDLGLEAIKTRIR